MQNYPKIGLPIWKTGENSVGATQLYYMYLSQFGEVVFLNPFIKTDQDLNTSIDLLVLPGGSDVSPERYNEPPHMYTGRPDPVKEYFDTHVVPRYMNETDIPIFGICRGFQTLAVMHGYPLVQHMYHETNKQEARWDSVHDLNVVDFFIEEMFTFNKEVEKYKDVIYYESNNLSLPMIKEYDKKQKKEILFFGVNSLHHQAVRIPHDDPDLVVIATYKGDYFSCTEAFINKEGNIGGVQFHPEELFDEPIAKYLIFKLLYQL